jgi:hypothetical protein
MAKSQGSGAFSAVCRDEHGRFMGCSSIRVNGITCHVTLEAMACAEAISLAADLHANKFMIASDCLSVVKKLQIKQPWRPSLHGDKGNNISSGFFSGCFLYSRTV